MSSFHRMDLRCAVCGAVHRLSVLKTTNAVGWADLDLRPPPLKRYTMPFWLQECPSCGYVARRISKPCGIDPAILRSEDYRNCESLPTGNELCRRYYRFYLLCRAGGDVRGQLFGLLGAVWICDDGNDGALAAELRRRAAALIPPGSEASGADLLLRADLLRRSGQFRTLLEEYRRVVPALPEHREILRFQLSRAEAGDDGRYTLRQAIDGMLF